MRYLENKRGMSGLITVVMVMGFMMAISSSYVLMVQTESSGTRVTERYDRARMAAIAGVEFVRAQLQATSSTYLDDACKRIYFARSSDNSANGDVQRRMATTTPNTDFTAVAGTQWYYPIASTPLLDEPASSTLFKITSYPDNDNIATAYYVKSIGVYNLISTNTANVQVIDASWSCQLLARLNISNLTKQVRLEVWRPMQLEPAINPGDAFFSTGQTIK
ncbi:MAG: hypothetical protein WA705_17350 [Candidatus Ozemobacteraceae bacterium]